MAPKYKFKAETVIKTGDVTQENVNLLRKMCLEDGELPELNQEQLVLFLLCCHNDVETAHETVLHYFHHKVQAPELFFNRDTESTDDLQKSMAATAMAIMPTRCHEDSTIFFAKLTNTSYYNFHLESLLKIGFMCVETSLYSNPPHGLITIFDAHGFGWMHLTRLRLGTVKKALHYLQEGMQIKLKEVHVFHVAGALQKLMVLIRPFIKHDLYEMIHLHSSSLDMNEFFEKYVSAKCMPRDYGGELADLEILSLQTYENLRKLKEFYKEEEEQLKEYHKR